ncbi:BlaI/MecI/CopY family transcriptional regulator [Planctomycetaceae bacterium SH139]
MAKREANPLTEAQREIMETVWELGEVTVSDVHVRIAEHRAVARNTVQTLMVRLEEKGWLRHVQRGRKFVYSAARTRSKSLGARVAHMVDFMFAGSPEQMVNALLEHRSLSESELQNIRELIEQAELKVSERNASESKQPPQKGRKQ